LFSLECFRGVGRASKVLKYARQARHHVDRQREHNGRVLLSADLYQRLQVAELDRGRLSLNLLGCHGELLRCLEFALRRTLRKLVCES
jgi:hypothetical protein